MKVNTLKISIEIAWWFTWVYLPTYVFVVNTIVDYIDSEFEPNEEKIEYWIGKAIRIKKA